MYYIKWVSTSGQTVYEKCCYILFFSLGKEEQKVFIYREKNLPVHFGPRTSQTLECYSQFPLFFLFLFPSEMTFYHYILIIKKTLILHYIHFIHFI